MVRWHGGCEHNNGITTGCLEGGIGDIDIVGCNKDDKVEL